GKRPRTYRSSRTPNARCGWEVSFPPHSIRMTSISPQVLQLLWSDFDAREEVLRDLVSERLQASPPPTLDDSIVVSYFFAFRSQTLAAAVKQIAYHATSGTKNPPPGSLLEQCTATGAGIDAFDSSGRIGLLHIAYPLKMLLQADGH